MATDDSIPIARLLPSLASFAPSEIVYIASLIKSVDLKKGEFFLQFGEEVTEVAIVDKGILCRYYFDQNGHKIIDKFLFNNQFFTDREGYFSHQNSFTNIQAITPCHLWTIPIEAIEALKISNTKVTPIIDGITNQTLNHELNIKNMLQIKDPMQRILRFYELHPHYWPFILKEDIQCYLRISHTTFYRILNNH